MSHALLTFFKSFENQIANCTMNLHLAAILCAIARVSEDREVLILVMPPGSHGKRVVVRRDTAPYEETRHNRTVARLFLLSVQPHR